MTNAHKGITKKTFSLHFMVFLLAGLLSACGTEGDPWGNPVPGNGSDNTSSGGTGGSTDSSGGNTGGTGDTGSTGGSSGTGDTGSSGGTCLLYTSPSPRD